jgi:hypothetical protein
MIIIIVIVLIKFINISKNYNDAIRKCIKKTLYVRLHAWKVQNKNNLLNIVDKKDKIQWVYK